MSRVLVQPINVIFKHLQTRTPVILWLLEKRDMRLEGVILGFDEFMNIVLGDATKIVIKPNGEEESRKELGRILVKGENVALIQPKAP